jgi:hypothetical protein
MWKGTCIPNIIPGHNERVMRLDVRSDTDWPRVHEHERSELFSSNADSEVGYGWNQGHGVDGMEAVPESSNKG